MTEDTIAATIRGFIQDNFLYMRPGFSLGDDDSLLKKGVIDSMGVLEVLGFVEETFGVSPTDAEVTEANMGSINAIARFLAAKQASSGAA